MITFVVSILCLVTGYFIYGRVVERVFGVDPQRKTPAYTMTDGVDYTPMPMWKVYLIEFLNIAGTGPIFGVIQGILFGPAAYLWIVLGCIFGGAVHDYMFSMISLRNGGASLPEVVGGELGNGARIAIRVLSLVLLFIVGAVFVMTPVGLLSSMSSSWGTWASPMFWTIVIFGYYFLASLLPIGKVIGRLYPLFGVVLIVTALALMVCMFIYPGSMPEVGDAFTNHHPDGSMPLFPGLFITISCGAVSGFHATQSPMMVRCITSEKYGRSVFYGAMITEGIIALIWAGVTLKFVGSLDVAGSTPYEKLLNVMTENGAHSMNPALLVNQVCNSWLGSTGAILAFLGIVIAPITTGDTAFRSARLIASEFLHIKQDKFYRRLVITLPIFAVSIMLMVIDFAMIWRYLGFLNQLLSAFTLWTITMWLLRRDKCYYITLIPALFMTMVCGTYFVVAPEGLHMDATIAYVVGAIVTVVCYSLFVRARMKYNNEKIIK